MDTYGHKPDESIPVVTLEYLIYIGQFIMLKVYFLPTSKYSIEETPYETASVETIC